MVAAAVDSTQSEAAAREAVAEVHATLPVYLATPETRRRFGVQDADPPIHLLIDERGQVAAVARARWSGDDRSPGLTGSGRSRSFTRCETPDSPALGESLVVPTETRADY